MNRHADDLYQAASDAGIHVLHVRPTGDWCTLTVARRRDTWALRLASGFRASVTPGTPWAVVNPEFDVLGLSLAVWDDNAPVALVTPVPTGTDPWLHHGDTWDVTIRGVDVPAVTARLGGAR